MERRRVKREATSYTLRGFTIVELLIVIVVIGILAAITIVAYNGIVNRATEATMQSDLKGAATTLEIDRTQTGSYPEDAGDANDGQGLKASGDNQLVYVVKPYGYCASVTNSKSSKTFRLKSFDNQTKEGTCDTTVETFAGTGTSTVFNGPYNLALDAAGTFYIADSANHRIRKVASDGTISTLAGSGTAGTTNGTGTSAQLGYPEGITVDASGNVYAGEAFYYTIRKITPSGVTSTVAGSPNNAGCTTGTGSNARFGEPGALEVGPDGFVYIVDRDCYTLLKMNPSTFQVTTVAGTAGTAGYVNGTGTAARFYNPMGLAIAKNGNMYVSDCSNHRIRKVTPDGEVTLFAGNGSSGFVDGNSSTARFYCPTGVAVDGNGVVYVADQLNHAIRYVLPSGEVKTLAGNGSSGYAEGLGSAARFNYPLDVTIDSNNVLYITDAGNNRVRKITL